MPAENPSFLDKSKNFFERMLALKVTDSERVSYAGDFENIFSDDLTGNRPLRVAAILALIFHLLLVIITFPSWGSTILEITPNITIVQQLARPAQMAGAEGAPKAAPPKPEPVIPEPKPKLVPIPDPTPNAPEPIRKKEIEDIPKVIEEIAAELNIGDVTAPPGPPAKGGQGKGSLDGRGLTEAPGDGPGTGGNGPYRVGGGVSNPQILIQTTPSYTDDAIKAKAQGVVLLQAVIRANGRADSFKVLRGLGFGLEESAIQEIAAKWKFRPGMRAGEPVDVLATIEVTFNLR